MKFVQISSIHPYGYIKFAIGNKPLPGIIRDETFAVLEKFRNTPKKEGEVDQREMGEGLCGVLKSRSHICLVN